MPIRIEGTEVKRIREALGLPVAHFASVLGVHPTTVNRWEAAGPNSVPIEGVPQNVLLALRQRVASPTKATQAAGNRISNALVLGGALLALGLLIKFATEEES